MSRSIRRGWSQQDSNWWAWMHASIASLFYVYVCRWFIMLECSSQTNIYAFIGYLNVDHIESVSWHRTNRPNYSKKHHQWESYQHRSSAVYKIFDKKFTITSVWIIPVQLIWIQVIQYTLRCRLVFPMKFIGLVDSNLHKYISNIW